MKKILPLAAVALLAISAPAFAQSSGAPGATGTAAGSGSNPPGSGVASPNDQMQNNQMLNNGSMRMHEGRASSTEAPAGDKADDTPRTTRGDQNGQGEAK